ncbi:MAG TPA: BON domain-containing protein [Blastocatellia bacterium]|nr:BON domain-containing protein [Blastocatellia bacterium]
MKNEASAQERPRVQTERRAATPSGSVRETTRLVREIRHELLTLPNYGVFDWLEGEVQPDGIVVLRGQVVRPTTKSDAAARVQEIEGVEKVIDQIQALPLSPNDDRLRVALYRAIFNDSSPLFRYALGANPTIHIIVDNGRATLKGTVNSEMDKQLAYTQARSVAGVFDVKNELSVEKSDRQ